jgi:hypothetical protein
VNPPKADNVPSDYDEVYNRQNDILYLDRNSRYDEMVAHPATIPMTKDSICSASLTIRQFATTDIKRLKQDTVINIAVIPNIIVHILDFESA